MSHINIGTFSHHTVCLCLRYFLYSSAFLLSRGHLNTSWPQLLSPSVRWFSPLQLTCLPEKGLYGVPHRLMCVWCCYFQDFTPILTWAAYKPPHTVSWLLLCSAQMQCFGHAQLRTQLWTWLSAFNGSSTRSLWISFWFLNVIFMVNIAFSHD